MNISTMVDYKIWKDFVGTCHLCVCMCVCVYSLSNETIVTRPLCVLDLCSRQRDFLRQSRLLLDPWKVHVSVESIEIRDDKE